MSEIAKTYEPAAVEAKWQAFWLENGFFVAHPERVSETRPAYSIVIPPPNVTGVLTLGHVLNNTIQDILARRARMLGREVLWLPGTDHAGIATQTVVERTLKKQGVIRHRDDLGRERFLEKTWEWKEKHGGIIIEQLKKLGCSCDWSRERFTMDAEYSRCVSRVFVDLYKKGLIYRGKRMVNWCPASLTALSDEEVVMKPQHGTMYHFKVEVLEPGRPRPEDPPRGEGAPSPTWLTIATTRSETIPGDTAIAVNPKDARYAHLIGRQVVRPLPPELPRAQRLIPIVGDDAVDFAFGTGVLKVTPAHDKADFEIGQRHGLAAVDIMQPDGTMNALAGAALAGRDRFEARTIAAGQLRELGVLVKEEPYQNNVGYSERADVPSEPRLSEQWFLKYPSVEQARLCLGKAVAIISLAGTEEHDDRTALREAAMQLVRAQGWIGRAFLNEDTGWQILVRRKSLSHAFNNRNAVAIRAVAALPALIRSAVLLRSEAHEPPHPRFKQVHHFVAALAVGTELHAIPMTVKELADGRMLYDHKAKKVAPGGKPLVAHLREEKLGIQPAPGATVEIRDLLGEVNSQKIRFFPERWARVYEHWMANIQDWCISRQLWWGHRIPVWTRDDEIYCGIEAPAGEGWQQDPDVLDTWFSSWLWPFATMGWPDKTDTLAKFYPTTDLVTGPDIIFFWVARMIMAGFEYMGEMPFRNVYFTGIIRDKQGRKMSKSLGNSPDPLDLIATFGADALRFGVMRSAPLGADILFDEKNVELGRNFCTKLWNAARFRQMQGGETEGEIAPALLTSDDQWILLRLDGAITEVSTALDEYRFSDAAHALYRFFWSEFCDWYLEASKASLLGGTGGPPVASGGPPDAPLREAHPGSPRENISGEPPKTTGGPPVPPVARKNNTLAVIDFVLAHTLRLMHPFLPFITEELWRGLGFHEEMPDEQGGRTIMFAPWPAPLGEEFRAHYGLTAAGEQLAAAKYECVNAGRGLRRDFHIASSKRVRFVLQPSAPLPAHESEVLRILLNAEPLELLAEYAPPAGTPTALTPLGTLYLPLEGLVDVAAERTRLGKELARVQAELDKARAKLGDPNFAAKVPAKVLEEHRQRERDWADKLAQLERLRDALGGA